MKNVLEYLECSTSVCNEKIVCADANTKYTFGQLQDKARRAGSYFARHTCAQTPIAFFMEKSCAMLAGFLGAVYAGCFYAAINPQLPKTRIEQILSTLNPAVVVVDKKPLPDGLAVNGKIIALAETLSAPIDSAILHCRRERATDADPLYVMFTSGSTGVPKGVVVCHRSVIDFIDHFHALFSISNADVIGNQAPFDFDISVKDIYSALATGARLEIIPRQLFSFPTKLADHIRARSITTLIWAVSALRIAATKDAFGAGGQPSQVNKILFSGEVMPPKLLRYWQEHVPGALFVNLYGPTEITCNCTYHIIEKPYTEDHPISIGKEYPNKRVTLLDENNVPVTDPGIIGELCVTGSCLALGYYNNIDATSAAFKQSPLMKFWHERMYYTGDLAKYGSDGLIYYVGRKDTQIKHHGHRIEMGDIEFAASSLSQIARCCCLYHQDTIIMFYEGTADPTAITVHLRDRLPPYMLPGKVLRIKSFPSTPNGKVDRAALVKNMTEMTS